MDVSSSVRRSLTLPPDAWDHLQDLAKQTNSVAERGSTAGDPSWRSLVRRLALGDLRVVPCNPAVCPESAD